MTESNFLKGIKRLEAAFRIERFPDKSFKLYWERTKTIPDKEWDEIIEDQIEQDDFFPSIRKLRTRGNVPDSSLPAGYNQKYYLPII